MRLASWSLLPLPLPSALKKRRPIALGQKGSEIPRSLATSRPQGVYLLVLDAKVIGSAELSGPDGMGSDTCSDA